MESYITEKGSALHLPLPHERFREAEAAVVPRGLPFQGMPPLPPLPSSSPAALEGDCGQEVSTLPPPRTQFKENSQLLRTIAYVLVTKRERNGRGKVSWKHFFRFIVSMGGLNRFLQLLRLSHCRDHFRVCLNKCIHPSVGIIVKRFCDGSQCRIWAKIVTASAFSASKLKVFRF